MNEKLIFIIFLAVVLGFIWMFLRFKPVREFLYFASGALTLFFVFKTAFNGDFWFLDLSKLELVGFILIAYLINANCKQSESLSFSPYNSIKRDFIFLGLPVFYVAIAFPVLLSIISKRNLYFEFNKSVVFSETSISTTLLLIVIISLIMRNVALRFSSLNKEVSSCDNTPEAWPASEEQGQEEAKTKNIEVASAKAE